MKGRIEFQEVIYPRRLKLIDNPPPVLYYQSGLSRKEIKTLFQLPAVAVVGSRKMSFYGEKMAKKFTQELVELQMVIVSGMARGIDGVAHRTALEKGGKTIAVLGSGVDVIYPPENKDIYQKLAEGKQGMVISEFPPGTRPEANNFPRRNRIIAGLADCVLVVEAARRSGTLITARLAAEQLKVNFSILGYLHPKPLFGQIANMPHGR